MNIFKLEKKLLDWIEKHFKEIFFISIFILSILIRISVFKFVSGDANASLLPWFRSIKNGGGFSSLGNQVGDYNILYQELIAIFTYLPFKPLYSYKMLSCIFDYLLAILMAIIVYEFDENKSKFKPMLVFVITILFPIVLINSSLWAQCDSIYCFFVILSLFLLYKDKTIQAFLCFGVAIAFKLQAIFVLPVFFLIYFKKKNYSIINFILIPITMIFVSIPSFFFGRNIKQVFSIYLNQTNLYAAMYLNYPNLWGMLNRNNPEKFYPMLKNFAILITLAILMLEIFIVLHKKIKLSLKNILIITFLMVYTCVIMLPCMHERYAFVAEIIAILIVFIDKKTILLALAFWGITLIAYSNFLFFNSYNVLICSIMNIIIFILYIIWSYNYMIKDTI